VHGPRRTDKNESLKIFRIRKAEWKVGKKEGRKIFGSRKSECGNGKPGKSGGGRDGKGKL
jgi:hypothetical protein